MRGTVMCLTTYAKPAPSFSSSVSVGRLSRVCRCPVPLQLPKLQLRSMTVVPRNDLYSFLFSLGVGTFPNPQREMDSEFSGGCVVSEKKENGLKKKKTHILVRNNGPWPKRLWGSLGPTSLGDPWDVARSLIFFFRVWVCGCDAAQRIRGAMAANPSNGPVSLSLGVRKAQDCIIRLPYE
jgi:hypothetical protein